MKTDNIIISLYKFFATNSNTALIICLVLLFAYIAIKVNASRSRYEKEKRVTQKGAAGEAMVSSILARLPKKQYRVINDVLITRGTGTSQIDHVVVSPYGIFVIETKNYSGCLIGNEFDEYMSYYIGEKHLNIYNPLKQNRSHVYALMKALDISVKSSFIPILTVSNDCLVEITSTSDVVHFSSLLSAIMRHRTLIFSPKEVDEIERKIREKNIVGRKEREKHIERTITYAQRAVS